MKEINEFPNIKATKLKEEIKNDKMNKSFKSKIQKKENYKGIKYCLLYFGIFSLIISLFVFNYIKTKDAFKENRYITLSSEKLCNETIMILVKCIKEKSLSKCQIENRAVEHCYNESYAMNQICFVYISELELCLRNNKLQNQKCNDYFNNVIKCGSIFRHLQIEKNLLKEIII